MLSFVFSFRPIELVLSNGQVQPIKQAFSGFADPENMLSFLQTPEFKFLAVAVATVILVTLALHGWAWFNMLQEKEDITPISNKQVQRPPSQNYVPNALLWQSSRAGFVPEYGLVNHKPEEPEPSRGESTPVRGGDLPPKPAA